MGDSSASYIHMVMDTRRVQKVQHLIQKCLLFHMSEEECMEALSKHADIKPVITSTVWKELEKENKEFFKAYFHEREKQVPEMDSIQTLLKMLSAAGSKDSGNPLQKQSHFSTHTI